MSVSCGTPLFYEGVKTHIGRRYARYFFLGHVCTFKLSLEARNVGSAFLV